MGVNGKAGEGKSTRVAGRLLAHRDRILDVWVERVRREVPAAAKERRPILVDTLPAVLRQLAEALSPEHPRRTATEGSTVAEEHGGERVRMTRYRLQDLVGEYKALRAVLMEVLEDEGPLSGPERATLNASVDEAIMKACTGYVLTQAGVRERFMALLAHDLRNPLAAAKAAADLILLNPRGEKVPRWAARAAENLDRLDRMIGDLLDAMRMESGSPLPLSLREADLVEIVRGCVEQLQTQHGDRFVVAAPEPVRGWVDAEALRRAVENLATNAVKYGAGDRPITLNVRHLEGRAFITVHNEGTPIPPEQQENLFQAFQRLRGAESGGARGWGLGLAQVRGVAEAHGGSIAVDSLPELGTTFTIDIPLDARPFQPGPPQTP